MSNDTIQSTFRGQLQPDDYFFAISFGILYYDYLLTLPMEVDRFWSSSDVTWASFFFYTNRYLSVLGHLPLLFEVSWRTKNPMDKMNTYVAIYLDFQYLRLTAASLVVATAFSFITSIWRWQSKSSLEIMRTFALYGRSRLVLVSLIAMACGVTLFGGWVVLAGRHSSNASVAMPLFGCLQSVSASQGKRFALAWAGMLAFDIIVFLLTLYKSLTIGRIGDRTLLNVLVRDGAMYFAVIAFSTLINILTFFFDQPSVKGIATMLTNVLSTTLISRLMLNLRDPRLKHEKGAQSTIQTGYRNPFISTFVDFASAETVSEWISPDAHKGGEPTIQDIELTPRD